MKRILKGTAETAKKTAKASVNSASFFTTYQPANNNIGRWNFYFRVIQQINYVTDDTMVVVIFIVCISGILVKVIGPNRFKVVSHYATKAER